MEPRRLEPDPLHAMQVLYQLSYGPISTWWLQAADVVS